MPDKGESEGDTDTQHHTRTLAEKICRADYETLIKQRHWHDTSITESAAHTVRNTHRNTHIPIANNFATLKSNTTTALD